MSVNRERLQRPVLKRTKPIRTVGGGGPAQTVADGVRLGYSVIEDYLKRGQKAAKDSGAGNASPFQSASNELQQLTERMFTYASDLASAWMELVQAMTTNGLAQRAANAAAGGTNGGTEGVAQGAFNGKHAAAPEAEAEDETPAAREPAADARPLSLQVSAMQPIEVTVDLRRIPPDASLEVGDLRAKDPAAAPLTGVTIGTPADPPRTLVRLTVPAGQPPGVYTGLVLDADTNLPCGTMAVRVLPGAQSSPK